MEEEDVVDEGGRGVGGRADVGGGGFKCPLLFAEMK